MTKAEERGEQERERNRTRKREKEREITECTRQAAVRVKDHVGGRDRSNQSQDREVTQHVTSHIGGLLIGQLMKGAGRRVN